VSAANSDPWFVAHHDDLVEIRPRVLVLNFDNRSKAPGVLERAIADQIQALAEGSRYLGYRDPAAPPFARYELAAIVDFTDTDPLVSPFSSSTRAPVDADNRFDVARLFTPEFEFSVPAEPSRSAGLCDLFESGAVNEVWLAVADGQREPPLMMERKQVYDAAFSPLDGQFNACIPESDCLEVECGVTVRVAHLNPRRGAGCDLQVRGWSIVAASASIPYFAENASAFFNADFRSRFGAEFDSFSELCVDDLPCVSYPSSTVAAANGTGTWRFDPYQQGCGSPEFPPNASARFDWRGMTPVESRCEHYGQRDGQNADLYEPYTAAKLDLYTGLLPDDPDFPLDCGGGWQMYWRQSMPCSIDAPRPPLSRVAKHKLKCLHGARGLPFSRQLSRARQQSVADAIERGQ
jgi:hypothetical protein